MKRSASVALLGAGIALGYAGSGIVPVPSFAASPAAGTDCAWPPELDAVAAAPLNHKVLLENERVRVLDVTIQPGERENVHAHCNASVLYITQIGAYKDYDANGKILRDIPQAPPAGALPVVQWKANEPPHSVHNLESEPVRLLRVELKS